MMQTFNSKVNFVKFVLVKVLLSSVTLFKIKIYKKIQISHCCNLIPSHNFFLLYIFIFIFIYKKELKYLYVPFNLQKIT
jgi:hypothetical protein